MKRTAFEILSDDDIHEIQAYADISIVVDGALGDEYALAEPQDDDLLGEILENVEREANEHGLLVEVYYQGHAHGPVDFECGCVQYETSHKPRWTWNA